MTNQSLPGRAYFALMPGTKKPAIREWQNLAPSFVPPLMSNKGLVLTEYDLILDVDVRNGGVESLKRIMETYKLPETRAVATPSGGGHLYFSKPEDVKVAKNQPEYPGIDFLSKGSYVCAPGTFTMHSAHSSEGYYQLTVDKPIADLPAKFLDSLEAPAEAVTEGAPESLLMLDTFIAECKTAAPAIQGQHGDKTTLLQAHRGRDLALPLETTFQVMRDHYSPRCQPPWNDSELYTKVSSAYKTARGAAGQANPEAAFMNFAPPEPPPAPAVKPRVADNVVDIQDHQDDLILKGIHLTELQLDGKYNILPTRANITFLLRHDPAWRGGFKFNDFSGAVEFPRRPAWRADKLNESVEMSDEDFANVIGWFSGAKHIKLEVPKDKLEDALKTAAIHYHPVKNYLNSVTWDGVPRLDRILIDTAGVADSAYARAVGRCTVLGAVKRIYEPGCKQDYVLVLEGRQGTRKSTWIATLGGEWYSTNELVRGDKDTYQNLRGRWLVELPEINATFSKADFNWLKGVISSANDIYRASYGHIAKAVPRESIFIATINPNAACEYLKDDENRRYWPVRTTTIDIERLKRDRDQYFAEAVHLYKQGTEAWMADKEALVQAQHEQEARREKDPWVEELRPWVIRNASGFTPLQARKAIGLDPVNAKSHHLQRLYAALRELGCEHIPGSGAGVWKKELTWGDFV